MTMSAKSARGPSQILSPQQRERLHNEAKTIEASLNGQLVIPRHKRMKESGLSQHKQGYYNQFMRDDVKEDKTILEQKLRRIKSVLERGTPQPLNTSERSRAEKQLQEDREWLKQNMTPRDLYYAKSNSQDFDRAKQAVARELKPEFQGRANRYIQNLRRLDPNNVDRNLLERLRPSN